MSHDLLTLPELADRYRSGGLLRLPPGEDVPLTPRVRRLMDTPSFRRLAQVSQLGLVQLVYPGARHSRQEHSLGVYNVALAFLERLARDPRVATGMRREEAERFLAAALLHDLGHWPYCHPLEDIWPKQVVPHETLARERITCGAVAEVLQSDWDLDPASVADLIEGKATTPGERMAASMLSGPIDVDKIDYLARDSLHAGVPYGRHFDQARLLASLCLDKTGQRIAVTAKGKTAAELMVFARYVMFSEVYWHHAVRSATAMLQRAMYLIQDQVDFSALYRSTDNDFPALVLAAAQSSPAAQELLTGLFGPERQLYKRLAQYSLIESPELYQRLARRPYEWLIHCSTVSAELASQQCGETIYSHEVLFDAPPVKLEVQFDVDVYFADRACYRPLGEVSPVVETLARQQFDDYVKRVRVLASPRVAKLLRSLDINAWIATAIERS